MAKRRFGISMRKYRWQELGLFIIPFLILLIEMTQLLLARVVRSGVSGTSSLSLKNLPTIQGLIPVLGIIAVLFMTNIVLTVWFPKADQMMLPLAGLLSGLGVVMALRIGPNLLPPSTDPTLGTRQLIWVLVGIIACIGTLALLRNMNWLRRYKYIWATVGIILVAITLVHGGGSLNGNAPTHDEIPLGPFTLQPSEFLKIFLVIFFAAYLSENQDMFEQGGLRIGSLRLPFPPVRHLWPLVLMLLIALAIFLVISELGVALLIYGIFLCMIYLGSSRLSYAVASLVVFLGLGFIGYLLRSYVRQRFAVVGIDVTNWSAASENLYQNGGGYQVVQGLIALSSGGILGSGIGLGHPTFVPIVQSDMIFTALGEELGLAGLFAIFGVYLLILYRGYRIAIEATDSFSQLLAAGLTSIFAIETIVIVAGNMKFIPLTGIPLPFLSYGGSSMIANFIIIGVLLRISYNTARQREGLAT